MGEEERYTFSSLMTSLIECERKIKRFFETAAELTTHTKLRTLLSDCGKDSSKRMEMIQRARVESVVEMMLEPITGIRLAELLGRVDTILEDGRTTNIEKAVSLERTMSELNAKVSPRITQMSADTSELLMALSRESTERLQELQQHLYST